MVDNMQDFQQVIDYIFDLIQLTWGLVIGNWIFSLFMLIAILGLVANLIKASHSD